MPVTQPGPSRACRNGSSILHPPVCVRFFTGLSGSDANETQAKLVWHYHNLIGRPEKKKIIARERGYHGCTVVSGSMTGMNFYHAHIGSAG